MRKEGKTGEFVGDSGSRTPIPENQEKCSSSAGIGVRLESESVFGFVRNECSASSGICTHARNLDYHVHVHFVIPAAAIDREQGTWRTKAREGDKTYLFNHNALATVFRAKLLDALSNAGLSLPKKYPKKWVVDCAYVGSGEPALIYLGRYLYRGVIQEKDIVACHDGKVTYRWKDSDSGHLRYKTVEGTELLWKLLQHVLPKRFRRARNFGFLHPNSKLLTDAIRRILCLSPRKRPPYKKQRQTMTCPCCGGRMVFIRFRIPRVEFYRPVALI